MSELRILFGQAAGHGDLTVRVVPTSGNASEAIPFQPFLTDADYEDLRWYLEEFMDLPMGGAEVRAHRVEAALRQWGHQLCDAIFPAGPNRALLDALLAQPEPRLLTVGTDDRNLLRLPWELLADDAGILASRVSVRRQLAQPKAPVPRAAVLPLRILYIVSRPADTGFLDPRLTTRSVFDALDPLGASVQVDFCRPPTLERMQLMLREAEQKHDPYDLVHFDGHGTFLPALQLGALCFEKPNPDDGDGPSATDLVRADRLGDLLAQHKIPLVVLEACRSATLGETAVFRSVAPRLIQAGVNSVLSMGFAVHVEAARVLLERFYRELATGTTIGHALAQGRSALLARPERWVESGPRGQTIALQDWFLPHLYQRGLDEPLFPPGALAQAAPVRQFDVFLSHNHADSPRVESLARVLSDKHLLRVWLDKWECKPGPLKDQCARGIAHSRYTVVVGSQTALQSKWVEWEIQKALESNPEGARLLPVKFENISLPPPLDDLLWVDFTDPSKEAEAARTLAQLIRSTDAEDARRRRGFRAPPTSQDEVGAFPPSPRYGFQGRARELHELEALFRTHRAILLHAMGGMGKTTLATEAAHWWARTGLFPDGSCFVSFEQFSSADRVVQVLGEYLEGPNFNSLPAAEQHRRAVELFQQKRVLLVWDNFESVLPQFQPGVAASRQSAANVASDAPAQENSAALSRDAATSAYSAPERQRLFALLHDLTHDPKGHGRLLITCRPGDEGRVTLPELRRLELLGLARPDSLWLLSRVLARDGLTLADPRLAGEKLGPLLDLLADHPLSIELVGPHLKRLTPEEIGRDFGKLLDEFKSAEADVERNRSLLASLAFSTRRLSAGAQAALPWLGLFSGGVFEAVLLGVSQMDPAAWETVRAELEATALLRVERDILLADRPYLRFHPTLAYAASSRSSRREEAQTQRSEVRGQKSEIDQSLLTSAATEPELRQRFISVYYAVRQALDQALNGSQSRAALEILAREEANYRTAVRWAVAGQACDVAFALGDTFSIYLQMSGRLRERDAWVKWLHDEVGKAGFTAPAADLEREQAWSLFTQGHPQAALQKLQALIERLRQTSEFDPAFPLATTQLMLGRVLHNCGLSEQAIPVLEEAVGQWEKLVEEKAGAGLLAEFDEACRSRRKEAGSEPASLPASLRRRLQDAATELGNLSATLGDLGNALRNAGRLDEALEAAERCLPIRESLGRIREIAAVHGQCARILMAQGRFAEADARYDAALAAARRAGDKGLEGLMLQHQGSLADDQNQLDRAASLYQRALKLFQEANSDGDIMRTCNLLGVVEQNSGRLAEARTWYERSREIAQRLGDTAGVGQAAQNIGIVCQKEGEAARQRGDEKTARLRFEEAKRSIRDSLGAWEVAKNEPYTAASHHQLSRVHFLLSELDAAEGHSNQAREINERLSLFQELWKNFQVLADIARARSDAAAKDMDQEGARKHELDAAEWERKRDAVEAELERRAQGPGGGGLPPQFAQAVQQLSLACAQAGFGGPQPQALDPGAESMLAQIEQFPAPLPDLAAFLRRLAARELPAVPSTLPPELQQFLTQLLQGCREVAGS